MEPETKTLREYLAVLRRRRTQFVVVAGTMFVIAWAVAWWLPSSYRSTATILIEHHDFPEVGAASSECVDGRDEQCSVRTFREMAILRNEPQRLARHELPANSNPCERDQKSRGDHGF